MVELDLFRIPQRDFLNDGEFAFGISTESPYNRLYAKMQFFPWMEAVLRYTEGTYVPIIVVVNKPGKTKE